MSISTLTPVFPPVDNNVSDDFLAAGIGGSFEEESEGKEGDGGQDGGEQGKKLLPPVKSIYQCVYIQ